jgi:ATP-dependent protease ClpP protease subunit
MRSRKVYLIGVINTESVNKTREQITALWQDGRQKEEITLFVCSGGGMVVPAISFYEWIKIHKIPLITVAMGEVASAAIPLFLSGKPRKATPHSWFIIHPSGTIGYKFYLKLLRIMSPRRYKEDVEREETYNNFYREIIYEETHLSQITTKRSLTKAHLILTPQEAQNVGFIQEIIEIIKP